MWSKLLSILLKFTGVRLRGLCELSYRQVCMFMAQISNFMIMLCIEMIIGRFNEEGGLRDSDSPLNFWYTH